MKLLLVGSGNRATAYARYFKKEIIAVADPRIDKAELLIERFFLENAAAYDDYKKTSDFDAIIIATPDYKHMETMKWAATWKKPILLEKPVEVTLGKLSEIAGIVRDYNHGIVLGFGLRYTFMYRKVLELVKMGEIGSVISIEASETLDAIHAAKFFRRWHRNSAFSGGLLNTKCSHDMDILNLIADSTPEAVTSFGTNTVFRPGTGIEVCSEACPVYGECIYKDDEKYEFSTADISICPYNIDSDIVDHQSVNILYKNGITAVFTLTMHSAIGNRKISVHGTKGSIEASFEDQIVHLRKKGFEEVVYASEETSGSHGGGDSGLCEFFRKCYERNSYPNQSYDGLLASAVAISADISRTERTVVDFGKVIKNIT